MLIANNSYKIQNKIILNDNWNYYELKQKYAQLKVVLIYDTMKENVYVDISFSKRNWMQPFLSVSSSFLSLGIRDVNRARWFRQPVVGPGSRLEGTEPRLEVSPISESRLEPGRPVKNSAAKHVAKLRQHPKLPVGSYFSLRGRFLKNAENRADLAR